MVNGDQERAIRDYDCDKGILKEDGCDHVEKEEVDVKICIDCQSGVGRVRLRAPRRQ